MSISESTNLRHPKWRWREMARPIVAMVLSAIPLQVAALEIGQLAPDLELADSHLGRRLSELRGKVVYVDFWASWCGPCRQSFPWMNAMQRKYAGKGLQIIAINVEADRGDALRFLARYPADFAVLFDDRGHTPRQFDVKGMPSSVLIGRDGIVRHVHLGFRLDDRDDLESRLTAALASTSP